MGGNTSVLALDADIPNDTRIRFGGFDAAKTKRIHTKLENIPFVKNHIKEDHENKNRVVRIGKHRLAVYILTLQDAEERNTKLNTVWKPVFGRTVSHFLYFGIHGGKVWGRQTQGKWGWDPKKQKKLFDQKYLSRLSGPGVRNLTPAEVAVGFGFLRICADIVNKKYRHTLVMENDANLLMTNKEDKVLDPTNGKHLRTGKTFVPQSAKMFRKKLKCVLDKLPADWDFVRLGACFSRGHELVEDWENSCGVKLYRANFALCNHGFLVSERGAEKFMQYAFPMFTTIDHQMLLVLKTRSLGLNDYDVLPHFLGQDLFTDTGGSTIGYTKMEELVLKGMFLFGLSPQYLMEANLHLNHSQKFALVVQIAKIMGSKKDVSSKTEEIKAALNKHKHTHTKT